MITKIIAALHQQNHILCHGRRINYIKIIKRDTSDTMKPVHQPNISRDGIFSQTCINICMKWVCYTPIQYQSLSSNAKHNLCDKYSSSYHSNVTRRLSRLNSPETIFFVHRHVQAYSIKSRIYNPPVVSPSKELVMRKVFPWHDVYMINSPSILTFQQYFITS